MVIEITTAKGETIKLTTDTVESVRIDNTPIDVGNNPPINDEIYDEWLNGEKVK